MSITIKDLDEADALLRAHGPAAAYDFLAQKGSKYAVLANGVAKADTLAGVSAISYMKERYFEDQVVEMPDSLLIEVKGRRALDEERPIRAASCRCDGCYPIDLPSRAVAFSKS